MFYVVNQNNSDAIGSEYKGHYYAQSKQLGMKSQDDLIAHMAAHNSTYSIGTITGVLKDMAKCVKELILEGYSVKLDDIAIISASIVNKTGGIASLEGFSINKLVEGIKMVAQATGDLSKSKINTDYTLTHWPTAKDALAGTDATSGDSSTDSSSGGSSSSGSGSSSGGSGNGGDGEID